MDDTDGFKTCLLLQGTVMRHIGDCPYLKRAREEVTNKRGGDSPQSRRERKDDAKKKKAGLPAPVLERSEQ